ncbi:unnamed protein product [Caretta caretta]
MDVEVPKDKILRTNCLAQAEDGNQYQLTTHINTALITTKAPLASQREDLWLKKILQNIHFFLLERGNIKPF